MNHFDCMSSMADMTLKLFLDDISFRPFLISQTKDLRFSKFINLSLKKKLKQFFYEYLKNLMF